VDNGEVDGTARGNRGTGLSPVWLVSKGNVLASANLATTRRDRRRGLIGVTDVHTPLVLRPCNWVHSVGMKATIDVAYVDADGTVLHTQELRPMRVAPWMRAAAFVIEAAAGSFERWPLRTGDLVEIREP
jgi:uncharacterized membrane protein (UPF0127 family)